MHCVRSLLLPLFRLSILGLVALVPSACGHRPAPAVPHVVVPVVDLSLLGDTDVRLMTEAMAYDVTHGPWLTALNERTGAVEQEDDVLPKLALGSVPEEVLPAGVPFPKDTFSKSLIQALRNARRVEVVAEPLGAAPLWRLDIAAQSEDGPIEGQPSRLYRVAATLRLVPHEAVAWQKVYTLRKQITEGVSDAADTPH